MKRIKSKLLIDILTDRPYGEQAKEENTVPNVEAIWNRMTPKAKSEVLLRSEGCRKETKEDQHGDTKSGWWQDTVFLGTDPIAALEALKG